MPFFFLSVGTSVLTVVYYAVFILQCCGVEFVVDLEADAFDPVSFVVDGVEVDCGGWVSANAFVGDVGDWLAGELTVVGECVVDEIKEFEHESALCDDVFMAAADGDLVGVEVSVDVDCVRVDPYAFRTGDRTGVEDRTGTEEEVLAVDAVAFVLEGHAYC